MQMLTFHFIFMLNGIEHVGFFKMILTQLKTYCILFKEILCCPLFA